VFVFAQAFPEATIVCAHWGGGLPFYELMPEVRSALGNVYYDTAASPLLYDASILPLLARLVPHKICFGSDFPLLRPARYLQRFCAAGLKHDSLQAVLERNAATILALTGDPTSGE
jgi:predicted TIM-barrel fold metal-dependent hydrolase